MRRMQKQERKDEVYEKAVRALKNYFIDYLSTVKRFMNAARALLIDIFGNEERRQEYISEFLKKMEQLNKGFSQILAWINNPKAPEKAGNWQVLPDNYKGEMMIDVKDLCGFFLWDRELGISENRGLGLILKEIRVWVERVKGELGEEDAKRIDEPVSKLEQTVDEIRRILMPLWEERKREKEERQRKLEGESLSEYKEQLRKILRHLLLGD